jgi:hypothetical protein
MVCISRCNTSRKGAKSPDRIQLVLLEIVQEFFGLFLEVFEIGFCG